MSQGPKHPKENDDQPSSAENVKSKGPDGLGESDGALGQETVSGEGRNEDGDFSNLPYFEMAPSSDHRVSIGAMDLGGEPKTDLETSIYNGDFGQVRLWVERKGACLDKLGWNNQSPLMAAALCGDLRIVRYLISKGARVDLVDDQGVTALFYAIERKVPDIVRFLLVSGANPNHSSPNTKETPLILALLDSAGAKVEIVELLLLAGASVFDSTERDGSLLQLAEATEDAEIIRLIRDRIEARTRPTRDRLKEALQNNPSPFGKWIH
jgi:Ankyrin repeats (3 copies)